jgi:enamine deaminase RidA (YjgF/YER057c/UK114 family)
VSGITSRDQDGAILHEGDIAAQCRQVMKNLSVILEDCGSGLEEVLQVRTFVRDMSRAGDLEQIWKECWGETWPASTLVEVSRLVDPRQLIEIEAVASVRGSP